MLGVGFAAATMRVGLCGRAADFWVAVLGWAFWGGGLPVVERVLLRCAKARGCWSFISHQSFIIYHSRSNCYFPCRRGSRDMGCSAKPKSVEGRALAHSFSSLFWVVWFGFWFSSSCSGSGSCPINLSLALVLFFLAGTFARSLPSSHASMNR